MNRAKMELPIDVNDNPVQVVTPTQTEDIAFTDTATAVDATYAGMIVTIRTTQDAWVNMSGAVAAANGTNKHANIKIPANTTVGPWHVKAGLSFVRATANNGTATVVAAGA